jgi:exosortase/archaeosortase family protein
MKGNQLFKNSDFKQFTIKFLAVFALLYFGTFFWIGFVTPGGYYNEFAAQYLDYISAIKNSLLFGTKTLVSFFGIQTVQFKNHIIRFVHGKGVRIAYDCVGYGVYSFWIAFVVANKSSFYRKIRWILIGLILLWSINVIRISLFLVSVNKNWAMPLGIDHHDWFTIVAYGVIFLWIFVFDKNNNKHKELNTVSENPSLN